MDTIFALATAPGKAGVAVVRISGPRAHDAVVALAGRKPALRRASLCRLKDRAGEIIDTALVLLFPEKGSFTGERVAELQLHGARATIAATLRALAALEGLRQADPGEFTRRALENGRMDLTEVEGLADLIDAETEAQRRQALRVLSGDLAEKVEEWRKDLIFVLSMVEVTIDFADEEVPVDIRPDIEPRLKKLQNEISAELRGISVATRIREGFEVAIIGPPNIGKSTLLNRLARRDAALVSEYAGTTRDVLELRMDVGGLLVTFLDTAGLRETTDHVERLGIDRARTRAAEADLRVILTDGSAPVMEPQSPSDLILRGKGDQGGYNTISGKTGAGVEHLLDHVAQVLNEQAQSAGTATHERHRQGLTDAEALLAAVVLRLDSAVEHADLIAEDLRSAMRSLDRLIGRIDAEEVLDEIFSAFCLGK